VIAAAAEIKMNLSAEQTEILRSYSSGAKSALIFEGMLSVSDECPFEKLPPLPDMELRADVIQIGVRSQILLKLVDHVAFAYDIDNESKIIRVVANFKGGGEQPLDAEAGAPELSSHSGLALGPHTEAPYWCATRSEAGHSPSPSALILCALWNPAAEPTSVIPLPKILESLGVHQCLALTTPWFQFTRSDSFVRGLGEDGRRVSILTYDESGGFAVRFNAYRFSVMEEAPKAVKKAYKEFCEAVGRSVPFEYSLSQQSTIVINNTRALHCRDIVRDNRRALVRLFGYSRNIEPVVYAQDPLLVRG